MEDHKKILVAYATNAGTTAEVAATIAAELGKDGTPVEVKRVEDVESLGAYSAVVIGAPMIMGWHKAARKFLKRFRKELTHLPAAYFFIAKSLTRMGDAKVDSVPLCIDPHLGKPPQVDGRLSLRESYATVQNYLWPAFKAAPAVRPVSVAFFDGVLNMGNMKWYQTIFVLLFVQAKPGGAHNIPFIQEWAGKIKGELMRQRNETN